MATTKVTDSLRTVTAVDGTKITGTIPLSSLNNAPATDLTPVHQGIATLALHMGVADNKVAFNLPNSFIDVFQDGTGITTETNVIRNAAEYVSSSTVTSGAYSPDANTKLLLHMEDTALTDSSTASVKTMSPTGGTARSGTQKKFSSYSAYFDGTDDLYTAADHADWDFGTGDYTIEAWFYTTRASGYQCILASGNWGGPNYDWLLDLSPTLTVRFYHYGGGGMPGVQTTATFSINTWNHVAVVRSSGTNNIYFNGTSVHSFSSSGNNVVSNGPIHMGRDAPGGSNEWFQGYLDEVRISNIARWASNFTPNADSTVTNATGTLISDPQTASSTTECSGVILYTDNAGTNTLGTDLKIYFTANNGTNWTEASSYGTAQTFSGSIKQVKLGKTTVTAGTQVAMKAVWANQSAGSKVAHLEGWAVNY